MTKDSIKKEFIQKIERHNQIHFDINGTFCQFYDFDENKGAYNWSDSLETIHNESIVSAHPVDHFERELVLAYTDKFLFREKPPVICDFGCSTGFMLQALKNRIAGKAVFIGVDAVGSGLRKLHVKEPEMLLFKFDIAKIPFPENVLDVVICLNVLEHIEDDITVLREFERVLKPGGVACIVVPYGDKLYDYYDESCMHVRRYGRNELLDKLRNAGFSIIRHSFLSCLLYIPFYIKKKINRTIWKKGISDVNKMTMMQNDIKATKDNILIRSLFALDNELSKRFSLPFGIREVVLVQKTTAIF